MGKKKTMDQASRSVRENIQAALQAMDQDELDEMVQEFKATEASEINNEGRAAQIAYLRGDTQ
jgi:hypothetical protein